MDRGGPDSSPPMTKRSRSTLGRYGDDSGDDRSPDRSSRRSSHYSASYDKPAYNKDP